MKHPDVLRIFEQFTPDRFSWMWLSANPYYFPLVEKHLDKVWWPSFCKNKNPNTMHLLKKHQDKVNWNTIWENPGIFEVDKEQQMTDVMELDKVLNRPK